MMRVCIICTLFLLLLVCGVIMSSGEGINVLEVETFATSGKLGHLEGWVSANDKFKDSYTIGEEEGNYFLEARVKDSGDIIVKEFIYNLKEFPILSWRWRALKLPDGGDERFRRSGDSVAGIYIIFPSLFKPERLKNRWGIKVPVPDSLKPECIKYVWSSSLSIGTVTESPYSKKTRIIVLENDNSPLNQWVTEGVNAYEDYKRLFHKEPDEVQAIGILTDADDTSSKAMADYDDVCVKRSVIRQTKHISDGKKGG